MWPSDNWWQCERCNFIHFESDPPQKCAVCRYEQFVKVLPSWDDAVAEGEASFSAPSE